MLKVRTQMLLITLWMNTPHRPYISSSFLSRFLPLHRLQSVILPSYPRQVLSTSEKHKLAQPNLQALAISLKIIATAMKDAVHEIELIPNLTCFQQGGQSVQEIRIVQHQCQSSQQSSETQVPPDLHLPGQTRQLQAHSNCTLEPK